SSGSSAASGGRNARRPPATGRDLLLPCAVSLFLGPMYAPVRMRRAERGGNSTLRELEALACLGTAGLLSLDLPGVTRQHALLAERGTRLLVVLHERPGHAQANRVALAGQAAAAH